MCWEMHYIHPQAGHMLFLHTLMTLNFVYSHWTSEHTTSLLWELHWLRILERIQFRLCVLAYHCVHGKETAYLTESMWLTCEIVARRRLRSVDSPTLLVTSTRRSTLGDRAFPVAAVRAWNSLPPQTRAASAILAFRQKNKSRLFRQSIDWQKSSTVSCWLIVHCHWDKSCVIFSLKASHILFFK